MATSAGVITTATPSVAAVTICNNISYARDNSADYNFYPSFRSGSSVTPNCDFRLSETYNVAVAMLQRSLNECYGPNAIPAEQGGTPWIFNFPQNADGDLAEDGKYGPQTQAAVKAVQTHIGGLTVDGFAGPNTRTKMRHHARGSVDLCTKVGAVPPYLGQDATYPGPWSE